MGLERLIAQSGAQNVERAVSGFMPNPAEDRAQGIYEAKLKNIDFMNQKIKRDFARADSQDELNIEVNKRQKIHTLTAGIYDAAQKDPNAGISAFIDYYGELKENSTVNDRKRMEPLYDLAGKAQDPDNTPEEAEQYQSLFMKALSTANAMIPAEQEAVRKQELAAAKRFSKRGSGGTAAERVNYNLFMEGKITQDEYDKRMDKLGKVKTGVDISETTNVNLKESQTKRLNKQYENFRKTYKKDNEYFSGASRAIDRVIALMESGDTQMSNTLMTQALMGIEDTNVRAVAMYDKFDRSYGDIATRIGRSVTQFISGERTEDEKAQMTESLREFQRDYLNPASKYVVNSSRMVAVRDGLDPFRAVPPKTPQEVKDSPYGTRQQKIDALMVLPR